MRHLGSRRTPSGPVAWGKRGRRGSCAPSLLILGRSSPAARAAPRHCLLVLCPEDAPVDGRSCSAVLSDGRPTASALCGPLALAGRGVIHPGAGRLLQPLSQPEPQLLSTPLQGLPDLLACPALRLPDSVAVALLLPLQLSSGGRTVARQSQSCSQDTPGPWVVAHVPGPILYTSSFVRLF